MIPLVDNKQNAKIQALIQARNALKNVDLATRCRLLGLDPPNPDGTMLVRMFGRNLKINVLPLASQSLDSFAPITDQILLLHYLQCDVPIKPAGNLISFRDLPGGQFYLEPYLARSITPLIRRVGNDLILLQNRLNNLDWTRTETGDLGAKIHILGKIDATLVYHMGDEEFPPAAELLYDASIRRVFNTEDVAVIASRICIALFPEPCVHCCGCGLCEIRTSYSQ